MTLPDPSLNSIVHPARSAGKASHARWNSALFDLYLDEHIIPLWERLAQCSPDTRPQSTERYVGLVAAGIGAGYLTTIDGPAVSLMEAFVRDRLPRWLTESTPDRHAKMTQNVWNIAEGARNHGRWIEQYLLARVDEFDNPLRLQEKTVELLDPVIQPRPPARWSGPFSARTIDLRGHADNFLPGPISQINPALICVSDRRSSLRIGMLLLRGGKSRCIGRMSGEPLATNGAEPQGISIAWGDGSVIVGGQRVELPLMGCKPLSTLAVPSGYLIASAENSQRLWVLDTP